MKKVVIVGFGGMGRQHRKLIDVVEGLSVIGMYDISEDAKCCGEEDGLIVYDSYDEVLCDDIDLVVIATPNHIHKEMAVKALKANKYVVCEKPVTLNSDELDEILEAEKCSNAKFVVHQNRRWDEDFLTVNQVISDKKIGDVFHIESRVHGSRGIPGDWRKKKAYGGGMMLDWGVHLVDRLLMMIDEKVKQVFCKLSYIRNSEVDDAFTLHLTFESGKTALVEVGTNNYIGLPLWYVLGTEGSLRIDDWELNGVMSKKVIRESHDATPIVAGAGLTKTMAPPSEESIELSGVPRYEVDYQAFYKNIVQVMNEEELPIIKNTQVMRVMKLLEAALTSSKFGQVIAFE